MRSSDTPTNETSQAKRIAGLVDMCDIEAHQIAELRTQVNILTLQRDSARRWVCHFLAHDRTQQARENGLAAEVLPQDVADDQGWDCFKRTTT